MSYYSNPSLSTKSLVRVLADARLHRRDEAPKSGRQRQHRLTPGEVDLLVAAYRQCASVKQLAQQFGIHRHTASAILKREGIEQHQVGLSPTDVTEAARLYLDGWSVARLGAKFGVDGTTVWRRLLDVGLLMREPWER